MNLFSGVGVALVTPFDKKGDIDENSLRSLINYVRKGGVDYLVALGTTSEAVTLSTDERNRVMEIILEENEKQLPVMVGIGGNNTVEVIHNMKSFPYTKACEAILSVTPYYNKPSQEGLYRHFREISEKAPLPVFLYNVPGRTGVNMSAATTVRLSMDCPNIIGIKEASGNIEQATEILKSKRENFVVVSGDDGATLPLMALGVEGVISVIANVCPAEFAEMVALAQKSNFKKAAEIHIRLHALCKALFAEGNPAGIKAALYHCGIIRENQLRLPLTSVSDELSFLIKKMIADLALN